MKKELENAKTTLIFKCFLFLFLCQEKMILKVLFYTQKKGVKIKDIMELEILKVGNDGEGIGYYNNKPVFVYYAYKDEIVDVSIKKNKRGAYEGTINKIIKPSKHRVKPVCPFYGKVGTTNLMHINYAEQLRYKKDFLRFHFERNLNYQINIEDPLPSTNEFYYRNKITVPVRLFNGKNKMGLFLRGTNTFFPIKYYIIHQKELDEASNDALILMDEFKINAYDLKTKKGHVKNFSIRVNEKGEIQFTFILQKDVNLDKLVNKLTEINKNIVSVYKTVHTKKGNRDLLSEKLINLYGEKYLKITLNQNIFLTTPDSFFQINTKQAETLFNIIVKYGNFKETDVVLDAFSGVGTIGTYISPYVEEVTAIEIVKKAVEANIESNKINLTTNLIPLVGDVIKTVNKLNKKFNVMIFDPPREGLNKEILNFILKQKPERIIYTSCNPETLGTDIKTLNKLYKVIKVIPVDMFPQTSHTESVTFLILK